MYAKIYSIPIKAKMDPAIKYKPIEVTTHNIYFHDESPILSTDCYDGLIATSGYDNTIRLWNSNFKEMKYRDSTYKTAVNSSVSIELKDELRGFARPINCVRFYKGAILHQPNSFLLAACSDGGKALVFIGSKCVVVRGDDGDDAYELLWTEDSLIIGFSSGKVEVYKIIKVHDSIIPLDRLDKDTTYFLNKDDINGGSLINLEDSPDSGTVRRLIPKLIKEEPIPMTFSMLINQKIHNGTIQGMSSCNGLLATHSIDKTVKVHLISKSSLVHISTLENRIDCSRGLFKRILFIENLLYVFVKNNLINIYAYPFRELHLHKKIGPLNSSVVKIVKDGALLFICTRKSVYILKQDKTVCCVDNACYMAITDGFVFNHTLFLSSMDGFLATIRLTEPNET